MPGRRPRPSRDAEGCTVTVCRSCCCGTERKHPGVDHAGQLAMLRNGIGAAGRVRVSECLDACAESNVVIVGPSAAGRRAGARPMWLSGVLEPDAVEQVVAWVRGGGPGVVDPPGLLDLAVFTPSRRSRQEAGEI